jgi:hypothetical protein
MSSYRPYSPEMLLSDLGGTPSSEEVSRLVEYYESYRLVHRKNLLQRLLSGEGHAQLLNGKLVDKSLPSSQTKQSKGGHGRWVTSKVRIVAMRVLYLRYRIDDGLTRRHANQKLLQKFTRTESVKKGQPAIRRATRSPLLDGPTKRSTKPDRTQADSR